MNISKIDIQVIPHDEQRYNTIGDYWVDDETLHLRVSRMKSFRYEFPVIVHELVEWFWACVVRGVSSEDIDKFDKQFETEKASGQHEDLEPGDMVDAPYYMEHQLALGVESIVVSQTGISWSEYEVELDRLYEGA